jgi:aminoglycoside 3-N-acetyltransferase I
VTFEIQRLAPAELPRMRELNTLFAAAFDDARSYAADPPDDAWLKRFLAREHVAVLVALHEGAIVGGLVAYELEKFERARREFYIYDLAVAEMQRRRGVATALIERLKQIARARQAWVIFVQGDHGDEPALALYDKLGTREEVLHFDIEPWGLHPHAVHPARLFDP